ANPACFEDPGNLQPSIDRRAQPVCRDSRIADGRSLGSSIMDAQVTERPDRQVAPSLLASEQAAESVPTAVHAEPVTQPVARVQSQPEETARQRAPLDEPRSSGGRPLARRWILACFKRLATLAIALVAIAMALVIWGYYVTAPWTRDGRVRVQVASVAPHVSGQITELRIG